MEAQRQTSVDVSATAAQPMSPRALLHGFAGERLTSRIRLASVAGMKTRASTGVAVAGVVQPELSAILLSGVAGERLTGGSRCASVAGMNMPEAAHNTGGGALLPSLAI